MQSVPVAIPTPPGIDAWDQVSAGDLHTCALAKAGPLYCWGGNAYGQLGIDNTASQPAPPPPVVAPAGVAGWASVAAGGTHTCAIAAGSSQALYCWGAGSLGKLGTGKTDDRHSPAAVVAPSSVSGWAQVSASLMIHSCAIATGGSLWCFGA